MAENPFDMPNVKALKAHKNAYRWRISNYRIIGILDENKEIKIIDIIRIAKRDDKTYKGL